MFRRAVNMMDQRDIAGLTSHLQAHPDLARMRVHFDDGDYFGSPSLLAFIAENPIRTGHVAPKATDIAKVVIKAGASADSLEETLTLVSSGRLVREAGVQTDLITLLCTHGARAETAMLPALGHGEFTAVSALLAAGAPLDLPTAAATGKDIAPHLPQSGTLARHQALALAAQHGHAAAVTALLDAGEDPNRFNPDGCHAHSTPLHQAALAGHVAVVRALRSGGARSDMKDLAHNGTAADWARHAGHLALATELAP